MSQRTIYFLAGEASGDIHGAALMQALQQTEPSLVFTGRGGPRMQAVASGQFQDWIGDAAVLGLWEVINKYGYFRRQFRGTLDDIARDKPDAVVLIDYPGFNLRLARALQQRVHRPKIIYFISPQVWAWHRGRIRQMARCIDLMLCIFPFEADLYNESGLPARFIGHPMIDRLPAERTNSPRQESLVALFPGSREREVRKILPTLVEVAKLLKAENPGLRFEVAAASPHLAGHIQSAVPASIDQSLGLKIVTGDTAGIMQRAAVGLIASGSATLEAAYFRLPFVLIYRVTWLTYLAARMVVRVQHLGMPNLLAGREIVPEFIQHQARPAAIAKAVSSLLTNRGERERMIRDFDDVVDRLGSGGASQTAAREILRELGQPAGLLS
jgi:lipid-A-disaccharide synthase